jgi:hypothetical protein
MISLRIRVVAFNSLVINFYQFLSLLLYIASLTFIPFPELPGKHDVPNGTSQGKIGSTLKIQSQDPAGTRRSSKRSIGRKRIAAPEDNERE